MPAKESLDIREWEARVLRAALGELESELNLGLRLARELEALQDPAAGTTPTSVTEFLIAAESVKRMDRPFRLLSVGSPQLEAVPEAILVSRRPQALEAFAANAQALDLGQAVPDLEGVEI